MTYPAGVRAWVARLRHAQADHHAIARGMAWVSLFVLIASAARAAKEMAIAYRFGVSAEVDAYLFVLNLVLWPVGIWFSVLTVVLVPLAARIRREGSRAELTLFQRELTGVTCALGTALVLLGWLGLPAALRSSWIGLPPATLALAHDAIAVLLLVLPLGVLISLFSAWMLAAGRHANTLLESVPALVLVAAVLAVPGGGIDTLLWATAAGFVCHLASLAVPLKRTGEVHLPRLGLRSKHWPSFWDGFGIMLAGQALMSGALIIDQLFAARLEVGAIATLSYANRVIQLLLGLGATAVSRATLPVFASISAGGGARLASMTMQWTRVVFAIGAAAAVAAWLLAPFAVAVLFERGAFMAADTEQVTAIFRYGLAQLPFFFAGVVFVSYLSSRGLYIWIFWSGLIGLCVKLLGNTILVAALGVGGITLATAVMYAVNCGFLWWVFRRTARSGE